jgi:hypothetical protein
MVEQIPARQDVLVSGALIGPTMPLRRALAILDSRPTSHPVSIGCFRQEPAPTGGQARVARDLRRGHLPQTATAPARL